MTSTDSVSDKNSEACPKCGAHCTVTRGSDPFTFHYKAAPSTERAPDETGWKIKANLAYDAIRDLESELAQARAALSAIEDKFTLELAEELFGCHLGAAQGNGVYECAICDHDIHISGWVTAKHADDCFINRVRDYLAKHKPECVPGWSAPTDGGANV